MIQQLIYNEVKKNNKNKKKSTDDDSLLKAYSSYLPKKTISHEEKEERYLSIQEMETLLQRQIISFGLKDIDLKLMDFQPLPWETKYRYSEEQVRGRKIFLKFLGYSHAEQCLQAGLSENDILLIKQSITPENYTVHIKTPFDFGGKSAIENMCLVRTHPIHDQIHALMEFQLEKDFLKYHKKLYIPIIEGIVKNA